jgi:hypothetical protein
MQLIIAWLLSGIRQARGLFGTWSLDVRKFVMARRRQLYEGKAKILFEGPEPGTLVQYFKDDATAFNAQKRGVTTGKGVLNNRISEYLMLRLHEIGVPTHFVRRLNMREQLIREVDIIPLEVVVRNIAAGSLSTRLGIPEGTRLPRPNGFRRAYHRFRLGKPAGPGRYHHPQPACE